MELTSTEINATWRMQYFLILSKTTACKFNNVSIGRVNAIQKNFIKLHEMFEQIKSSLLLKLLQLVFSYFSFHFPSNPVFRPVELKKILWGGGGVESLSKNISQLRRSFN